MALPFPACSVSQAGSRCGAILRGPLCERHCFSIVEESPGKAMSSETTSSQVDATALQHAGGTRLYCMGLSDHPRPHRMLRSPSTSKVGRTTSSPLPLFVQCLACHSFEISQERPRRSQHFSAFSVLPGGELPGAACCPNSCLFWRGLRS